MKKIGLIDYGMGNIHSVKKAIENLEEEVLLVNKKVQINQCKAIVVPGQGAFDPAVENLTKTLGQEWAEYKIRINAIAPGIIATSGLDSYPEVIKSFFKKIEKKNLMNKLLFLMYANPFVLVLKLH